MAQIQTPSTDEDTLEFESGFLTGLLNKWLKICKHHLPSRSDFLPEDIGPDLNRLMIISHRPDGDFEYRLVGSELEYYTPSDRNGHPFTQLYQGEMLRHLQNLFFRPLLARCPTSLHGRLALGHGEMILREALLLPLCRPGETVFTQILAGFIPVTGGGAPRQRMALNWL